MRRKIFVVVVALACASISQAAAFGVGVEGGLPFVGDLPGNNVALSLALDKWPVLGIGANFGSTTSLGLTADWWLVHDKLGPFMVYVGPGAFGALNIGSSLQLYVGGRVPIGLQLFVAKWFEIFAEVAPALGVRISSGVDLTWALQGALGIRFWF